MDARSWRFLRPDAAADYIRAYEAQRKQQFEDKGEAQNRKGWRKLELPTTRRQFRTARDILDSLNSGQQGLLLADDVGLGKTTVAALCALVVAGKQGRVRILAPNEMMARRWRQELALHIGALAAFAPNLDLSRARVRLGENLTRLGKGQVAVSTHAKANQLACDLLIVDEVHRTRSEESHLASIIRQQNRGIAHLLVLTATPFSIDSRDLARLLRRVGAGLEVITAMENFAGQIDALWKGKAAGDAATLADRLVASAEAAVAAISPYVIRHGVCDLSKGEKPSFGDFKVVDQRSEIGEGMLEAMLRTDRGLLLARRAKVWSRKRRNDPRYHVASGKLLADLLELQRQLATCPASDAEPAAQHVREALRCLRQVPVHPKIKATADEACGIVDANEKVLVFCDHHVPAGELAAELAARLQRHETSRSPAPETWRRAWELIVPTLENPQRGDPSKLRSAFLDWLCSDGIRAQIGGWLGAALRRSMQSHELVCLLQEKPARGHEHCDGIASHALELYGQLTGSQSGSTRSQLLKGNASGLPGGSLSRVCAVCEPPAKRADPAVFFSGGQPDVVQAIFNSPFGPDVLVATDKLSEGIDLHRYCRHLIHHELDPSPVRTVQRNGRLRRVGSWAARTEQPIIVSYPALEGTRDERAVEIMQMRLRQFDLLLGGVGQDIDPDEGHEGSALTLQVLQEAGRRMPRLRLDSAARRKRLQVARKQQGARAPHSAHRVT